MLFKQNEAWLLLSQAPESGIKLFKKKKKKKEKLLLYKDTRLWTERDLFNKTIDKIPRHLFSQVQRYTLTENIFFLSLFVY